MIYRDFAPEPLTPEMVRVMQEWYRDRDSAFWKFSIGDEKPMVPVTPKQFRRILADAAEAHRLWGASDKNRQEHPFDGAALISLCHWALRQIDLYTVREDLRKATRAALDAGLTQRDVVRYVENVVEEWALPTD